MTLFDVPGWTMPADIQPSANTRKRKRPGSGDGPVKLQSAGVNMEKLMKKLGNEDTGTPQIKENKARKEGVRAVCRKDKKMLSNREDADECNKPREGTSTPAPNKNHEKPKKKVRPRKEGATRKQEKNDIQRKKDAHEHNFSVHAGDFDAHLTSLQTKMKESLDGARFRWINETLYKSSSKDAERLMHEDSKVFEEYHVGFRHQVTSWPSNPVKHFIEALSSYPERTVIVDLGCGDAELARDLVTKGFTVLSYDLVAANSFIVATDICDKLPIPGSDERDEGQIVDVVVCSLSLMSTNWLNCIREARRVLKTGGELKIAEVSSRFMNVEKFTSVISLVGFSLVSKDEQNSHFSLFNFQKTERTGLLDDKAWNKIMVLGNVLQPCEYKRR